MTISEILSYAKGAASSFQGDAEGFFGAIRAKSPVAATMMENAHARYLQGISVAEKLKNIFAAITPSKASTGLLAQAKSDPDAAVKSAMDRVEALSARADALLASKQAEASKPAIHLEQIGRQVVELATSPVERVSRPVVRGIERSIAAQAAIDAKIEAARSLPRSQRLRELARLKHGAQEAENEAHSKACYKTRDEILTRSRAPFSKK